MNKNKLKNIVNVFILILILCCVFLAVSCGKTSKTTLKISDKNLSLEIGESYNLTIETNSQESVTWQSSNEDVAEVSQNGEVFAYTAGTVHITATVEEVSTVCIVTVNKKDLTTDQLIIINTPEVNLKVNQSIMIEVEKINVTGNVVFETTDEDVVSVDTKGKLTAKRAGNAQIVAKIGSLVDYCLVMVTDDIEIILQKPNDFLLCNISRQVMSTLLVNGEICDSNLLSWNSSDESVIEVENGVVIAKSDGVAKITASYNEVSSSIDYEVKQTISSVDDFVNMKLTGRYILSNDIDFNNQPIESIAPYFSTTLDGANSVTNSYLQVNMFEGSIDGNGYSLKNVVPYAGTVKNPVNGATDAFHSLLGCIGKNGVVKNLSIYGRTAVNSGQSALLAYFNLGTIENVYAEMTVYKDGANTSNQNAPLVSDNRGTVRNCISTVLFDSSINPKELFFTSAMFGKLIRSCNVENCFAFVNYSNIGLIGEMGNSSSYSILVSNSEKFNTATDLLFNANLSSFDTTIWEISYTETPKLIKNYLRI